MYHDHHFHPIGYAHLLNGLELMSANRIEDLLGMVKDRGEVIEGPIIGQRLNDEGLAELRLPTAADIDDVVPDRPVLLYRYCGHIAIANSAALAIAGVDSSTSDPAGGSLDRDRSGRPTGVLRETAIALVSDVLGPITRVPSDTALLAALATLPAMGIGSITGIVSYGPGIWGGGEDELDTLIRLAPDLPIDVDVLVITDQPGALADAAARIGRTEGRIRFLGWKDFSDGSLGGHTAAMHEPFSDRPDTRGTVRLDHRHALTMGLASADLGGTSAIHAIGDLANDLVLDVMADLVAAGVEPTLLRVEHASVLTESAVARFADLGVTASVQPAFLASEESWVEKRVGSARMSRVYPFRSLLEAGVHVIGGSDAPVEHPEPETAIHAATHRPNINPSEALTREQAIALFQPPARA